MYTISIPFECRPIHLEPRDTALLFRLASARVASLTVSFLVIKSFAFAMPGMLRPKECVRGSAAPVVAGRIRPLDDTSSEVNVDGAAATAKDDVSGCAGLLRGGSLSPTGSWARAPIAPRRAGFFRVGVMLLLIDATLDGLYTPRRRITSTSLPKKDRPTSSQQGWSRE